MNELNAFDKSVKACGKIEGFTVRNADEKWWPTCQILLRKWNLMYFRSSFYKGFQKEHFYACKDILYSFLDKNREDKNHTVLYAPTQSGKTTCMTMLTDIISVADFKEKLNIRFVVYLTGDNQCGLTNQSRNSFNEQTKSKTFVIEDDPTTPEDYIDDTVINIKTEEEEGRIPVLFIKQSDCKKAISILERYDDFFNNTLIIIDESHYGTKIKNSQVNNFLEKIGCDMANSNRRLLEKNVFILSVSATPWNELFSDEYYNSNKYIVRYQPGEKYKGFNQFINNNNIVPIESGIDNIEDFTAFFAAQLKKIKKIGSNIGKAVIFRINEKAIKLQEKELKDLITEIGFYPYILSSANSRINYEDAENAILSGNGRGVPVAIIIYEAYKHGIDIGELAKKEIVTVYDFRKSQAADAIDATEQGLLGRMCGYKEVDLNNLEIYINKTHYDGLLAHNDGRESKYPSPIKTFNDLVECTKDEWEKTLKEKNITGKDRFDYIKVKKVNKQTFKLDEFLETNTDKYGKDEIKDLLTNPDKKPKNKLMANIIKDFVAEMVQSKKIKANLKGELFLDGRREKQTKDSFAKSIVGDSEYLHYNRNIRDVIDSVKTVDNGEYIWSALISSLGKDGKLKETNVKITVVYGVPVYAKKAAVRENIKRKLYSGYKPVETVEKKIEEVPVINVISEEKVDDDNNKKTSWWNRLFQ